nr:hypothetical protein [Microbacterium algeriense]
MLWEDMTVQMRHPVTHDQVVDLSRCVHGFDGSTRALHVGPEGMELLAREAPHVRDVLSQDHQAVPGVSLVACETEMRCRCRDDQDAVLVLGKMRVATHAALARIEQRFPLVTRPPHSMSVAGCPEDTARGREPLIRGAD